MTDVAVLLDRTLGAVQWLVLGFFLVVNSFYAAQLVAAVVELRRHRYGWAAEDRRRLLTSKVAPRISVLAPAHNEEATVEASLQALLTLQYPNLEVVLVNDGSSDQTLAVAERAFGLEPIHPAYWRRLDTKPVRGVFRSAMNPDLVVVDKENGGKADALNVALNMASGELVCAIDADTILEPDALLRMARPFLNRTGVLAAGGTIRVVNGSTVHGGRVVRAGVPRNPLAGMQFVEYLRAFLFGRLGWNRLGGNLIISGAFGLFRREAVITAGGYLHDTVGEDMELVARLRRRAREAGEPDAVEFVPDPVAWTEAPETLRVLGRQRDRWHRGLADVLWRHRRMVLNPRYGALGLVTFPYFLFVELLAPVIEAMGLLLLPPALALEAVDGAFALALFLAAYGYAMVLTTCTLLINEAVDRQQHGLRGRMLMLVWAVLENFGYRQLTVVWRLRGLWKFARGRTDWGTMTRRGFTPPAQRDDVVRRERAGEGQPPRLGQNTLTQSSRDVVNG